MVSNLIGHVLAYHALGLRITGYTQGGDASLSHHDECGSSLDGCTESIAAIMSHLLCPASLNRFQRSVGSQCSSDGQTTFFYRCECCGELTCAPQAEWAKADIMLELGAPSGVLAVHVTLEGIEWCRLQEDGHEPMSQERG